MAPKKIDGNSDKPIESSPPRQQKQTQRIEKISSSGLLATPPLHEESTFDHEAILFDPQKEAEWQVDAEVFKNGQERTLRMPGDKKPETSAQSPSRISRIAIMFFFLLKPFTG